MSAQPKGLGWLALALAAVAAAVGIGMQREPAPPPGETIITDVRVTVQ